MQLLFAGSRVTFGMRETHELSQTIDDRDPFSNNLFSPCQPDL